MASVIPSVVRVGLFGLAPIPPHKKSIDLGTSTSNYGSHYLITIVLCMKLLKATLLDAKVHLAHFAASLDPRRAISTGLFTSVA